MNINYAPISNLAIQHHIKAYIEEGMPCGGFLSAVIENKLFEAFGRADSENSAALLRIVTWFYNYAPSECYGNSKRYESWMKAGGLEGLKAKAEAA